MKKILALIFPIISAKKGVAKSYIILGRALMESLLSLIIIIYGALYFLTPSAEYLNTCGSEYYEKNHVTISCDKVKVLLVTEPIIYSFLAASLNTDELAMTGYTDRVLINSTVLKRKGIDVKPIIRHELEHINQRNILGYVNFYMTDKFILEGGAEYYRGKPTKEICEGFQNWGGEQKTQFYFESWAKAYFMLEIIGIPYEKFILLDNIDEFNFRFESVQSIFCPM